MVLPSSREIEDAWEEVAGREDELEEEPNAEEEPGAEEQPEAEGEPEAEIAQSPAAAIINNLQESMSNDMNLLFSPETRK